jgi:flagellin
MSLRINTNVTALNALRNLQDVSGSVSHSIERLSSGLRINRAADDPAGLIISESLRSQIDGLNQAVSNSQDATNLIKTAEGSLTEVNALLRNVRQLAVHAANTGVNDQVAVQADQAQISSAISSIQRIAEQTQFGTKRLLDGSSGISAAVVNTGTLAGVNIGGVFNNLSTQNGTVNITVSSVATRAEVSGAALATYASVNASLSTVNGVATGSGGSVVINGQTISVAGSDRHAGVQECPAGRAARAATHQALEREPALEAYYLLPSGKGALLQERGDAAGAAVAYEEALKRPCSEPEKRFLLRRLSDSRDVL